ncbi:MAG: ABC transporter ATP-binding protein [Peptococcaceae bacterium]
MTYALELKNVSKQYENFALQNISLVLPRGCIMGMIGENGAGKSTTIKLLLDLIKRDGGEIEVLGVPAETFSAERNAAIGVVMDECSIPDMFHVKQVDAVMRDIYANWDSETFYQLISRFGLPLKSKIKTYSRGMKMKLSIAVALSHNAQLLILDEATSGLDPVVRDEILEMFQEFMQDEAHAILMASHITSDLEKICDYITYIHQGHIELSMEKDRLLEEYGVFKGSEEQLKTLPADAVLRVCRNSFGVEALVKRSGIRTDCQLEQPTLEGIMLFFNKGMLS